MNLLELIEQKDLILDYVDKRLYNLCNAHRSYFPKNSLYHQDPDFRAKVDSMYRLFTGVDIPKNKTELGLDEWVGFDNSKVESILTQSPHRYICMFIAFSLLDDKVFEMEHLRYRPAQDYLLLLSCGKSRKKKIGYPPDYAIEPDRYIRTVIQAFNKIDDHMDEGREKNLYLDLVIIHDELCGTVMDHFDIETLSIAKEIFDFIDQNSSTDLIKTLDAKGRPTQDYFITHMRMMKCFSEKFVEIGKKYFSDGRLEEGELAYNYLMAHAEEAIWGNWREEDDAL